MAKASSYYVEALLVAERQRMNQFFKRFFKKNLFLLIFILVLATVLRFYKLAQVPSGMTWDEAAIGYNGQAILNARRDEWLERLPVSFKSFGDFKAPLAIYLNGIFTEIFGMNLWAVRLPFALSGVGAVLGLYYLTQSLIKYFQIKLKFLSKKQAGLVAALLLAISPWHLHFTRTGFESGLALTFIIWGCYWLLLWLQKMATKQTVFWKKLGLLILAVTSLIASLYTYHSAKLFTPLILLFLVIKNSHSFWQEKLVTSLSLVWSGFILRPLVVDSLYGHGLERGGTLLFSEKLPFLELISQIVKNLASHLNPGFLILGETDSLRHGPGQWAVLLPITYGLILLFLTFLRKKQLRQKSWFLLFWVVTGLLPAVLGKEVPQANRALLALPGFLWLAVLGLDRIYSWVSQTRIQKLISPSRLTAILVVSYLSFFGLYLNHYYSQFATESAAAFNDGYLEAMEIAVDYEQGKNDKPEVGRIIFTSDYGQPYIYALFVRKTNPIWYQGGSLRKFQFANKIDQGDLSRENTLVVASQEDDLPAEKANHLVYGTDGSVRFKIYYLD